METKKKGEWCEITVPAKWNGISIESVLKVEWEYRPKSYYISFVWKKVLRLTGNKEDGMSFKRER